MLSTPAPDPSGGPTPPDTSSTADLVGSLIDTYNLKQSTRRFHSVDEVALDLHLPPRPRAEVGTWIDRVARAVDDSQATVARKPQLFP